MGLEDLFGAALKRVDPLRGFELLASLSRLHRVQGSEEIVVAVEHVAHALDELGIEYRYENLRGPLGLHEYWGFWEPRGWTLNNASLEVWENSRWREVISTDETPLVAIAGSPPGSAEGVLRFREPPVLATDSFNQAKYYMLEEQGAEAIVAFHLGPGIRYWGLYPPHFRSPPTTLAISVPGSIALGLVGKKIRVSVDASYDALSNTPILRARIGSGSASIVLVAHICHPRPGSHDNASGVAVLFEALAALSTFTNRVENAGLRIEAFFVPEWTGTATAHIHGLLDTSTIIAGLSVDMVAANLGETGGALRIVRSPPPMLNIVDPVLDLVLSEKDGDNYASVTRYEPGSDHDVLLSLGAPASMLNEWPDKYYHTSLDTPDHISVQRIRAIAAAIASSLLYITDKQLSTLIDGLRDASYPYRAERVEEQRELLKQGIEYTYARVNALIKGEEPPSPPWSINIEVRRRMPTLGYLYLSGYKDLATRLSEKRKLYESFLVYAAIGAATKSTELASKFLEANGLQLGEDEKEAARAFLEGRVKPA